MTGRFMTEVPSSTEAVLADIGTERERQFEKWGPQHHPDGTLDIPSRREARERLRALCDARAAKGKVSWLDILNEEQAEAAAETDLMALRKELVQTAAVAVAWIEDIDSRASFADAHDLGGEG